MDRVHGVTLVIFSFIAVSWATHIAVHSGVHHGMTTHNSCQLPRQTKTVRPAFSVGLTHNMTFVQNERNVVYDRVFIDSTSSYDPSTGVYTVPISGDYVVMIHALAELDGTLWLELHRNDDYLFSAYAHTTAQYSTASNVGVVHFSQGDRLQVLGRGTSILYGRSDELYATLSAFLLYADKAPN